MSLQERLESEVQAWFDKVRATTWREWAGVLLNDLAIFVMAYFIFMGIQLHLDVNALVSDCDYRIQQMEYAQAKRWGGVFGNVTNLTVPEADLPFDALPFTLRGEPI